ncbi:holo-ACP synthase [Blochmannia endosymbiont of Camponotus (Colobopsis) obliquus]|uniref:holo-ACP synthase n=1 Tax=Blochmannia endosymbiont of Camponotus (Colobopsis) obliquus TaxID=1505597 RepID=UPI00061A7F4F|nr:holo-ACP synthase [Blochmannia endosymbiont of Camponotus (Colobopsis) obliquus]AKC60687.1 holo-[acyl-carrier-protein] synthase [Blochmannia endosymbiont of Camponotus (Colobopsis) obliquus]
MTIYGIGVDIVEVNRIKCIVNRIGEKFARRILTDAELKRYHKEKCSSCFLAKRFAAKEATVKAFGFGMRYGLAYNQFEILNDELGKPKLCVFLNAAILANKLSILRMHVTLTDDKFYACAVVIFEQ